MPRTPQPTRLVPREREETKNEKFRRLANKRFRAFKADLRRLVNLRNTDYEASDEQIELLVSSMTGEFDFAIKKLRGRRAELEDLFSE